MVTYLPEHRAPGYFAPTRFEAEIEDCETVGTIPPQLAGAFYRLHADWLYPAMYPNESSLSGDGYISMLRFKDGGVDYRGRYVRTDRYLKQRQHRRQLYGYYRNPYTDDPEVSDPENPHLRTSANTTPVVLAGKLYAAKEEGLPYEIDPNTLATIGVSDFGGEWASQTFTAHPKRDPVTGETFAFGYEATGLASNDVYLYSFDAAGKITWEVRFEVPYSSLLHDMAITENYVVIPGGGCVTSKERLEDGKIHWGWDTTRPSYYALIPRGGTAEEIRWFSGEERSIVHVVNAWEEEGKVFLDAPMASGNTWPWFEDVHGASFQMPDNSIRRIAFDLRANSGDAVEEVVFELPTTSFTRIDERLMGRPYRYTWVQFTDPEQPFNPTLPDDPRLRPNNCYGRFDMIDRTMTHYFAGPDCMLQEPVFVPRDADAPEGVGYLIGTAHNLTEMRTEIVIVDAEAMTELARVILPFRNAGQIHGTWAGEDELPLA